MKRPLNPVTDHPPVGDMTNVELARELKQNDISMQCGPGDTQRDRLIKRANEIRAELRARVDLIEEACARERVATKRYLETLILPLTRAEANALIERANLPSDASRDHFHGISPTLRAAANKLLNAIWS